MRRIGIVLLWLGWLVSGAVAAKMTATVQVQLEPANATLQQNVLATLSLERQKNHPRLTPDAIRRYHRRAPEEIQRALQPFGYYRVEIKENELDKPPRGRKNPVWHARYTVALGEPIKIRQLNLHVYGDAKLDSVFQQLIADLPLKEGDVLNHVVYEQVKRQLLDLAQTRGYEEAHFTKNEIRVDKAAYHADINLTLASGTRYRFGAVTFKQDRFKDELLRQYIPFKTGDFFSSDLLSQFRNNLTNTNFFSRIVINQFPRTDEREKSIALQVELTPHKPNQFRIRAGFGTDTGARTRFDWLRRHVNQYGHRLGLGLIGAQTKNKLVLDSQYVMPLDFAQSKALTLFSHYEGRDLDPGDFALEKGGTSRLRSATVGVKHSRVRQLWNLDVEQSIGLQYMVENYDAFEVIFGDNSAEEQARLRQILFTPEQIDAIAPDYQGLIPFVEWLYRDVDDPIVPTHGQTLKLRLQGSSDGLGANFTFAQARLSGAMLLKLGKHHRFLTRGDVAYTHVDSIEIDLLTTNVNLLPEDLKFSTGGDFSVRGYGYESLRDPHSFIASKHLLVGSTEYEYLFLDKWGVASFYDTGNAFDDYSALSLKSSVGLGLRWYSPVGIVRLDVARPFDSEDSYRIHFTIGPSF